MTTTNKKLHPFIFVIIQLAVHCNDDISGIQKGVIFVGYFIVLILGQIKQQQISLSGLLIRRDDCDVKNTGRARWYIG